MLHKGYKFAIKGRKNFKAKTFFFKAENIAKKYTRILNRGLLKVMFGAGLLRFNEIPKSIKRLLDKSPNLQKLIARLNPVFRQDRKNQSEMKLTNQAGNVSDSLTNYAMKQGKYHAKKEIKTQAMNIVK